MQVGMRREALPPPSMAALGQAVQDAMAHLNAELDDSRQRVARAGDALKKAMAAHAATLPGLPCPPPPPPLPCLAGYIAWTPEQGSGSNT